MPLAVDGLRPTPLRRGAGRPQLKRDPLGSTYQTPLWSRDRTEDESRCRRWSRVSRPALLLAGVATLAAGIVTLGLLRAPYLIERNAGSAWAASHLGPFALVGTFSVAASDARNGGVARGLAAVSGSHSWPPCS